MRAIYLEHLLPTLLMSLSAWWDPHHLALETTANTYGSEEAFKGL